MKDFHLKCQEDMGVPQKELFQVRTLGKQESRTACPVEIYSNRSILPATYAIKNFPIATFKKVKRNQ